MKNKGVIISIVIVLALVGIVVFRTLTKKVEEAVTYLPTVETTRQESRDIVLYTEQIASIENQESVSVYPQMAGEILTVNKQLGDRVEAGEELATIKSDALASLKIQVDQASIHSRDAQSNYDRTAALHASGGVSQQVLEQAASARDTASLAYSAAKTQYDLQSSYTVIKSPITGTIDRANIKVHDMAAPQGEAFLVTADGGMIAKFGITEDSKAVLNLGDEISIEQGSQIVKAHVTEISNSISPASGLYDVKAALDPDAQISAGSRLKVSLVDSKALGVKTIPISAVSYTQGKAFVYVYQEGKVLRKEIEVGIHDQEYIEVKAGLADSDEVIYTWSNEIYDGAEVAKKE